MIYRKEPVKYAGVFGELTIYHTKVKDLFTGQHDRYEVVIQSPVYSHDSGLVKAKEVPIICKIYRKIFEMMIKKQHQPLLKRVWNKLFS